MALGEPDVRRVAASPSARANSRRSRSIPSSAPSDRRSTGHARRRRAHDDEEGYGRGRRADLSDRAADIFVGGDCYTGPKFAIDAIAAGKEAISLHRYVHPGQTPGRRPRPQSLQGARQGARAHRDGPISIKITARCRATTPPRPRPSDARHVYGRAGAQGVRPPSGCGATKVDSYLCIGCGLCTTKCKFDAIHQEGALTGTRACMRPCRSRCRGRRQARGQHREKGGQASNARAGTVRRDAQMVRDISREQALEGVRAASRSASGRSGRCPKATDCFNTNAPDRSLPGTASFITNQNQKSALPTRARGAAPSRMLLTPVRYMTMRSKPGPEAGVAAATVAAQIKIPQ